MIVKSCFLFLTTFNNLDSVEFFTTQTENWETRYIVLSEAIHGFGFLNQTGRHPFQIIIVEKDFRIKC